MTDDQYRALRQLMLDMAVRIEALELHLKRQDDIATHRAELVYQWCAPMAYKADLETTVEVSMPVDLKKLFLKDDATD